MLNILAQVANNAADKVSETAKKAVDKTEQTGLNKHLNCFFESLTAQISAAKVPQIPTQTELCEYFSNQQSSTGIIFLIVGLVIIALGGKFYKLFMSLNTAILAACVAGIIAVKIDQQGNLTTILVASGVVFGLLAWPLVKFAAGICCSIVGAALGYIAVESIALSCGAAGIASYAWVGGIIFAILLGLLGFMILPIGVRLFLTLEGTLLTSAGLMNLVLKNAEYKKQLVHNFQKRPVMLPCIIGAIFIIGFAIQLLNAFKKKKEERNSRPEPADERLHYRD